MEKQKMKKLVISLSLLMFLGLGKAIADIRVLQKWDDASGAYTYRYPVYSTGANVDTTYELNSKKDITKFSGSITANGSILSGGMFLINNGLTLALPNGPSIGENVKLVLGNGQALAAGAPLILTTGVNGENINGSSSNLTLNGATIGEINGYYVGSTTGWRVKHY
jgi:hypothetical protein